jgi:hypothetical protein
MTIVRLVEAIAQTELGSGVFGRLAAAPNGSGKERLVERLFPYRQVRR